MENSKPVYLFDYEPLNHGYMNFHFYSKKKDKDVSLTSSLIIFFSNLSSRRNLVATYLLIYFSIPSNAQTQIPTKECIEELGYCECNGIEINIENLLTYTVPTLSQITGHEFVTSECESRLKSELEQIEQNDRRNINYLKNSYCSHKLGWVEIIPNKCNAGGPPPVCPVQHWRKDPKAMEKWRAKQMEIKEKRIKELKEQFERCTREMYENLISQGNDQMELGNFDKAVEYFDQASRNSDDYSKKVNAQKKKDEALNNERDQNNLIQEMKTNLKNGNIEEARENAQKAKRLSPLNTNKIDEEWNKNYKKNSTYEKENGLETETVKEESESKKSKENSYKIEYKSKEQYVMENQNISKNYFAEKQRNEKEMSDIKSEQTSNMLMSLFDLAGSLHDSYNDDASFFDGKHGSFHFNFLMGLDFQSFKTFQKENSTTTTDYTVSAPVVKIEPEKDVTNSVYGTGLNLGLAISPIFSKYFFVTGKIEGYLGLNPELLVGMGSYTSTSYSYSYSNTRTTLYSGYKWESKIAIGGGFKIFGKYSSQLTSFNHSESTESENYYTDRTIKSLETKEVSNKFRLNTIGGGFQIGLGNLDNILELGLGSSQNKVNQIFSDYSYLNYWIGYKCNSFCDLQVSIIPEFETIRSSASQNLDKGLGIFITLNYSLDRFFEY